MYYDYYAPGHTLNRSWCKETGNLNKRQEYAWYSFGSITVCCAADLSAECRLEQIEAEVMQNLSHLTHAPGEAAAAAAAMVYGPVDFGLQSTF